MRLNKFLSAAGVCSRRKADELIQNGKVVVNGKLTTELGTIINEKSDEILVDGKKASLPVSHVYIKLNKPKGYACTASDEHGRKTIYELIDTNERLFSIGRLDYDTEGLIILTNDGDFANHVAHPSYEIEKEYVVKVKGDMLESELAVLRKGVVENGVRMPKAGIKKLGFENLPICVAKTQYSLSDNQKLLGAPKDFELTVRNIEIRSGAGFLVVLLGNMLLMPGLSKNPAAVNMTIDESGKIEGLF